MLILVLSGALALGSAVTSYAGWKQDDTGYWWQNDDGSYPTSSWHWLDGNGDGIFEMIADLYETPHIGFQRIHYYTDHLQEAEKHGNGLPELSCYNFSNGTYLMIYGCNGPCAPNGMENVYEVYQFDGQRVWKKDGDLFYGLTLGIVGNLLEEPIEEWRLNGNIISEEAAAEWLRQYQEGAADVFKVHMNEENINRNLSGDGQATVKQN